ncbi:hypothetical protein EGW08_008354, partial [Elysia chlorotica]
MRNIVSLTTSDPAFQDFLSLLQGAPVMSQTDDVAGFSVPILDNRSETPAVPEDLGTSRDKGDHRTQYPAVNFQGQLSEKGDQLQTHTALSMDIRDRQLPQANQPKGNTDRQLPQINQPEGNKDRFHTQTNQLEDYEDTHKIQLKGKENRHKLQTNQPEGVEDRQQIDKTLSDYKGESQQTQSIQPGGQMDTIQSENVEDKLQTLSEDYEHRQELQANHPEVEQVQLPAQACEENLLKSANVSECSFKLPEKNSSCLGEEEHHPNRSSSVVVCQQGCPGVKPYSGLGGLTSPSTVVPPSLMHSTKAVASVTKVEVHRVTGTETETSIEQGVGESRSVTLSDGFVNAGLISTHLSRPNELLSVADKAKLRTRRSSEIKSRDLVAHPEAEESDVDVTGDGYDSDLQSIGNLSQAARNFGVIGGTNPTDSCLGSKMNLNNSSHRASSDAGEKLRPSFVVPEENSVSVFTLLEREAAVLLGQKFAPPRKQQPESREQERMTAMSVRENAVSVNSPPKQHPESREQERMTAMSVRENTVSVDSPSKQHPESREQERMTAMSVRENAVSVDSPSKQQDCRVAAGSSRRKKGKPHRAPLAYTKCFSQGQPVKMSSVLETSWKQSSSTSHNLLSTTPCSHNIAPTTSPRPSLEAITPPNQPPTTPPKHNQTPNTPPKYNQLSTTSHRTNLAPTTSPKHNQQPTPTHKSSLVPMVSPRPKELPTTPPQSSFGPPALEHMRQIEWTGLEEDAAGGNHVEGEETKLLSGDKKATSVDGSSIPHCGEPDVISKTGNPSIQPASSVCAPGGKTQVEEEREMSPESSTSCLNVRGSSQATQEGPGRDDMSVGTSNLEVIDNCLAETLARLASELAAKSSKLSQVGAESTMQGETMVCQAPRPSSCPIFGSRQQVENVRANTCLESQTEKSNIPGKTSNQILLSGLSFPQAPIATRHKISNGPIRHCSNSLPAFSKDSVKSKGERIPKPSTIQSQTSSEGREVLKKTVIAFHKEGPAFTPSQCRKPPSRRIAPVEVISHAPSPLQESPFSPISSAATPIFPMSPLATQTNRVRGSVVDHSCTTMGSPPRRSQHEADSSSPRKLLASTAFSSNSLPASLGDSALARDGRFRLGRGCNSGFPSSHRYVADDRTVITFHSSQSAFTPSHYCRQPSRRIAPTEVLHQVSSPLQGPLVNSLPSPHNSPALTPLTTGTNESDMNGNLARPDSTIFSEFGADQPSVVRSGVGTKKPQPGNCPTSSILTADKPEASGGCGAATSVSRETHGGKPSLSLPSFDSLNIRLPPSPSKRRPRRVTLTQISSVSSKDPSQPTALYSTRPSQLMDESKIVSSTSDLSASQSEVQAFKLLKSFIASSYGRPQPQQEITSSNQGGVMERDHGHRRKKKPRKSGQCGGGQNSVLVSQARAMPDRLNTRKQKTSVGLATLNEVKPEQSNLVKEQHCESVKPPVERHCETPVERHCKTYIPAEEKNCESQKPSEKQHCEIHKPRKKHEPSNEPLHVLDKPMKSLSKPQTAGTDVDQRCKNLATETGKKLQ